MRDLFDIQGRVFVVTGATGALAGSAADYLVSRGAYVAYLGRNPDKLAATLGRQPATSDSTGQALAVVADVQNEASLRAASTQVLDRWGRIDGLLNGAGGNQPGATIRPDQSFADLDYAAFREVIDLNLHGTVLPSLVFTPALMKSAHGSIVNFSSVSSPRVVSRVVGYSAAKASVDNFTRWLGVDLARRSGGKVRVNALMPGFFLGEQNRRLLLEEDGSLTERGQNIIRNTPFGRFGQADELHGAVHYLLSDASAFVTSTVLTVDGGFSAFGGV